MEIHIHTSRFPSALLFPLPLHEYYAGTHLTLPLPVPIPGNVPLRLLTLLSRANQPLPCTSLGFLSVFHSLSTTSQRIPCYFVSTNCSIFPLLPSCFPFANAYSFPSDRAFAVTLASIPGMSFPEAAFPVLFLEAASDYTIPWEIMAPSRPTVWTECCPAVSLAFHID